MQKVRELPEIRPSRSRHSFNRQKRPVSLDKSAEIQPKFSIAQPKLRQRIGYLPEQLQRGIRSAAHSLHCSLLNDAKPIFYRGQSGQVGLKRCIGKRQTGCLKRSLPKLQQLRHPARIVAGIGLPELAAKLQLLPADAPPGA
ncbi:hypothetical protein D3C73_1127910 [compost metagenome]